jgi:hypothetical protein
MTSKVRYIPTGYELHTEIPEFGIQVYAKAEPQLALMYFGKRAKAEWHYRFKSVERMEEFIRSEVAKYRQGAEFRATEKARVRELRSRPHGVEVGTIFRTSWGYEQTNVEYYEVVALIGKSMCELREIAQERTETSWQTGETLPMPGQYIGEPIKRKICMGGGSPSVVIHQSATAYLEQPIHTQFGIKIYKSRHWSATY